MTLCAVGAVVPLAFAVSVLAALEPPPARPVAAGPAPAVQPAQGVESWPVYRLDEYGVTLRHPPGVVTVPSGDRPALTARFRVWFQPSSIAESPLAAVAPPPLALDVFDNPAGESLDDWLGRSGAVPQVRFGRERAEVGGVPAVRVTGSLQLAPNVFYYVARGAFIYRFTPLGPLGDQMLASVSFQR